MLTKRIIPCLDCRDGRVVKGIQFQNLRDVGAPERHAQLYERDGADEIVLLDIVATNRQQQTQVETVSRVRREISIPLTVGGGVRSDSDVARLLSAGADKVALNTAAVAQPELVRRCADQFGVQCIVVAVDARQIQQGRWAVVVSSGQRQTDWDVTQWCQTVADLGAGELLLTSWDRDGTRTGYDLELIGAVAHRVGIPVIASGGANSAEHLWQALDAGADAVLAASIFHSGETTVEDVKRFLRQKNVEVRL